MNPTRKLKRAGYEEGPPRDRKVGARPRSTSITVVVSSGFWWNAGGVGEERIDPASADSLADQTVKPRSEDPKEFCTLFIDQSAVATIGEVKVEFGGRFSSRFCTDSEIDSGSRIGRESIKTQNRRESVFLLERRNYIRIGPESP
ncbi:hypothetical protein C8R47DRAFT_1074483 [Mycena vitilis]|nr:hypothetical protein C8R47DRAFT_1074483 [Mycena vitilis]